MRTNTQTLHLVSLPGAESSLRFWGRRCAARSTSRRRSADRDDPDGRREDDRTQARSLCCCLHTDAQQTQLTSLYIGRCWAVNHNYASTHLSNLQYHIQVFLKSSSTIKNLKLASLSSQRRQNTVSTKKGQLVTQTSGPEEKCGSV